MDVRVGLKKAECRRIDVFEPWCRRRLLRVLWTAKRSNQSILKEINPEYSLKDWCWNWNSNNLATWCKELTQWKRPWCWTRLKAGGEEDDRRWDGWMASPTRQTWIWVSSGSWWWTGKPGVLQSMGSQRVGHDWPTELNWIMCMYNFSSIQKYFISLPSSEHFPIEKAFCHTHGLILYHSEVMEFMKKKNRNPRIHYCLLVETCTTWFV